MAVLGRHEARAAGGTLSVPHPQRVLVLLLFSALALFPQAFLLPFHGPHPGDAKASALAELSRAVGVEAALCARPGNSGPAHNGGNCSNDCPLCRFPGQAGLLTPEPPSLIGATMDAFAILSPLAASETPPQSRVSHSQPRGPPIPV